MAISMKPVLCICVIHIWSSAAKIHKKLDMYIPVAAVDFETFYLVGQ